MDSAITPAAKHIQPPKERKGVSGEKKRIGAYLGVLECGVGGDTRVMFSIELPHSLSCNLVFLCFCGLHFAFFFFGFLMETHVEEGMSLGLRRKAER